MLASRSSLGIAVYRHAGKRSIHLGLSLGATHPFPQSKAIHHGCYGDPVGIVQPYPYQRETIDDAVIRGSCGITDRLMTMTFRPTSIIVATSLFIQDTLSSMWNDGLYLISTLKRRRKMMNKHKLRKRRKKNRMRSKK